MKDREQFDSFNRRFAPSVEVARSFRGEGEDPSKEKVEPVDPFAGIDFDSLSPEIKEKLEAAKTGFADLQIKQTKAQQDLEQRDREARFFQSRADRAIAVGQRHNLIDKDGNILTGGVDPSATAESAVEAELVQTLIAAGVDVKTAPGFAKIFGAVAKVQEKKLLDKVATVMTPAVVQVGSLQAEQLLDEAMNEANDPDGLLQDPDVFAKVQTNMRQLTAVGNKIDLQVINHLKLMATGEVMVDRKKKGKDNPEPEVQPRSQPRVQTRSSILGGNAPVALAPRQGSIPRATNLDTATAVSRTIEMLISGTKIKNPAKV